MKDTGLVKLGREGEYNIGKRSRSPAFCKIAGSKVHYYITWKMKFFIKDSSVNVTKFAVSCGSGQIYWRNP